MDDNSKIHDDRDWAAKYMVQPLWRRALRRLIEFVPTWSFVREFGELQILSRISYAMLIFVPLLASVWPVISEGLRYYHLYFQVNGSLPLPEGQEALYFEHLPTIWVLAYVGALCAAIAGTLYQAYAPDLVKSYRLNNYVESELESFRKDQSTENFSIYISELVRLYEAEWKTMRDEIYGRAASTRIKALNETLGFNIEASREGHTIRRVNLLPKPFDQSATEKQRDRDGAMQRAVALVADRTYVIVRDHRRTAAAISGILYLASLCAVVSILYIQAVSVMTQAGWL